MAARWTQICIGLCIIACLIDLKCANALALGQMGSKISFDALKDRTVLVVGGSGRVGGSCVTQLTKRGAQVTVAGPQESTFLQAKDRWMSLFPELGLNLAKVDFVAVDRELSSTLSPLLSDFDLVIHTAGPFQGKVKAPNGVLGACIQAQVPYIDVCDDYCTASAAQTRYQAQAKAPCIISTGCWPGVSSLMAKQLVEKALQENKSLQPADLKVDFSFFTAGSGGAGVTLLVATFLILAEKALTVVDGRRREVDAMKEYSRVAFGPRVGDKSVANLNLLETASIHDNLGVGNVQSLFGTAPGFWNALLGAMAQLPPSLLVNEALMRKLSVFSIPIVRIVDAFAGAVSIYPPTPLRPCPSDISPSYQPNLLRRPMP
jgi:saccharopine dehydrogenase-like NADP-dependent oxidoreductase